MADVKISALPASTTPLTGTEVLPLVQSGVTKKVAVSNLTGTTVSNAGEVGVGGNTEGVVAGVTVISKFCVKNEGSSPVAGFVHVNDTTAGSGSGTFACRSRGTLATPTIVQNNDSLWNMYIAGNDGTDLALAAQIAVEVDGTPGSNDMPGRIVFLTTPDGSQAPVEAMRINNAQKVTFVQAPVLSALTASTALALDASKNVVSVTNTGTGDNVLATAPTLVGDVTLSTGNLVVSNGKGIDFSATPGTGTSELLADYEEGTWTPTQGAGLTVVGTFTSNGTYTKVGRLVTIRGVLQGSTSVACSAGGALVAGGLPFTVASGTVGGGTAANGNLSGGSVLYVLTSPIYAITAISAAGAITFFASYYV
jgi:hypothetical protein